MHIINYGRAELSYPCACFGFKIIKITIDDKVSRHKLSKYYNIIESNKFNYDIIKKDGSNEKTFKHSPFNCYKGKCNLKYSLITSEGISDDKTNKIVDVCDRNRLVHLTGFDSPTCYELLKIRDNVYEFAWKSKLMNFDEARELTVAFLENV